MNSDFAPGAQVVIFDLDGTLTLPILDFDAIRQQMGLRVDVRTPILEALAEMATREREAAEAILHRCEEEAATASELYDDALEVVQAIRSNGTPVALLTRNSRRSVETVMGKHKLRVDFIHTREDGPVKPAPDAVLSICRRFGAAPQSAWVVGDYLFDLQAGNAAEATTVLMIGAAPLPVFADQADHVIRRLSELLPLMRLPSLDR